MLIKVCGLRQEKDIQISQEIGADFLGFIFHLKSPRYVTPEIVAELPGTNTTRVGVFVRQRPAEILAIMKQANLDMAQLHSDFTPNDCLQIGKDRVIKVFWPRRFSDLDSWNRELHRYRDACRYFLFDSGIKGGGHGEEIQSDLLSRMQCETPWFLAGGIGPENLRDLIDNYHPPGIDLNSGVENSPGDKDSSKLREIKELLGLE